jgi:hypothetical protein
MINELVHHLLIGDTDYHVVVVSYVNADEVELLTFEMHSSDAVDDLVEELHVDFEGFMLLLIDDDTRVYLEVVVHVILATQYVVPRIVICMGLPMNYEAVRGDAGPCCPFLDGGEWIT